MRPWRGMRSGGTALAATLAAAAALAQTPAPAGPLPSAVARASTAEVSVGEPFTVEVRASGPPGTAFDFPPALAAEGYELETVPPAQNPPPPGVHRYRAAVFALAGAQVPAIPVRYRLASGAGGEIRTAPVPLRVASILPRAKDEQKLADVRPPLRLGVGRAFWIALAVLALFAGALAGWTLRRRHAPVAVASAVPTLEPDEEARRALDALVASGRLAREEYRPYYIELTAVAKRYLERRLGAPILEMTTSEMLAHLRASPHGVDLAPPLRDLSGAADRIKFARGSGAAEEAERHLAAMRALVERLESRLRPAAEAGGGQAA